MSNNTIDTYIPLSVIIPAYNTETTLPKCLDSILRQTISIETIVINDGSRDNTLNILNSYIEVFEDSIHSLHIISQTNQGRMKARNAGFLKARGEFLGFVDSDDWIDDNMYRHMLETAKQEDADIVTCGFVNVDYNNNVLTVQIFQDTFEKEREYKILPDSPPSLCNSIFRHGLFDHEDLLFVDLQRGEDLAIVPCLFYYARNTVMLDKAYYYYRNIETHEQTIGEKKFNDCPVNLYKDMQGIEDLFEAAKILANFYQKTTCRATNLIPMTTKFPDLFNRYNYKYTSRYFSHKQIWEWYFHELLILFFQYPSFYRGLYENPKSENKVVLASFSVVFGTLLATYHSEVISQELVQTLSKAGLMKKYIARFRILLRLKTLLEFPIRVIKKC